MHHKATRSDLADSRLRLRICLPKDFARIVIIVTAVLWDMVAWEDGRARAMDSEVEKEEAKFGFGKPRRVGQRFTGWRMAEKIRTLKTAGCGTHGLPVGQRVLHPPTP